MKVFDYINYIENNKLLLCRHGESDVSYTGKSYRGWYYARTVQLTNEASK